MPKQLELDCYHKAEQGEPKFTLLARDPVAPDIVRLWASVRNGDHVEMANAFASLASICHHRYIETGDYDNAKTENAYDIADKMTQWQLS